MSLTPPGKLYTPSGSSMKTVAITGTSRGLGLALTRIFLANGWAVIAIGRHMPGASTTPNVRIEQCDLADGEAIRAVANNLRDVKIDVLINNAGVFDAASVDEAAAATDAAQLAQVFQVNTIAPKLLSELLVANLQAGEDKLIVSITSGMGTYGEFETYHAKHWAYSASKAALNYAMVSFAELHPDIKAALISPGWLQTDMGGSGAVLKPEESAEAIYDLVANHQKKLLNAEIVDYTGKKMDF
jgi:NAD(P)-dependent dehydrogenase (short-subunit alcohol dehydrogenase family)